MDSNQQLATGEDLPSSQTEDLRDKVLVKKEQLEESEQAQIPTDAAIPPIVEKHEDEKDLELYFSSSEEEDEGGEEDDGADDPSVLAVAQLLQMLGERKIYHFTHIENLSKIFRCGYLESKKELMSQRAIIKDVSQTEVQERRKGKAVPGFPNKVVHDFVPFYFTTKNPMTYRLSQDNRIYEQLVFFETSVLKVQRSHCPHAFSDKNASISDANFYTDFDEDYKKLDWEEIDGDWWEKMRESPKWGRKQAEFLILDKIPLSEIEKIIILNIDTREVYYPYSKSPIASDKDNIQKQLQTYYNSFDCRHRCFQITLTGPNETEVKALLCLMRLNMDILITFSYDVDEIALTFAKEYQSIKYESVKELKLQGQQKKKRRLIAKRNEADPNASSEFNELFYNFCKEKIKGLSQIIKRGVRPEVNILEERSRPLLEILKGNEKFKIIRTTNSKRPQGLIKGD